MTRSGSTIEGAALRRKLGAATIVAVRLLQSLGRRLGTPAMVSVPVSAAMLSRLPTVTPDQSLEEVAQILITGRTHVPLVANGQALGVITKDDVAAGLRRSGPHASVGEAPRHDVVIVTPSDSLADVLEQLREMPDAVAVVIDGGQAVGLLTLESLSAYAAQHPFAA